MTVGLKHDPYMDESIMGRYSAQILDKDSNYPDKVGNEQVVVMMLGVRSNQSVTHLSPPHCSARTNLTSRSALGMFAPGYKEVGDYFTQMVIDLEKHKTDKENGGGDNGFLGMSAWNSATDRSSGNEFMTISYWRSVDDIHRFAHAGIHSEAWKWWNKTVKQHPHVGIMHEIYSVPKQQWESIYVNYHPTQLAATSYPKKQKNGEVEWISPMVDANKAPFRTSAGRLGLNKGEKVSTEMGEIQY